MKKNAWRFVLIDYYPLFDLQPENLLLMTGDNETILKVADFGLSKFVGEQSLMQTHCGTPFYLAPEILTSMSMGGYTKVVDCWSSGVILYFCLAGYHPFSDESKGTLADQIKTGSYSFPTEYWGSVSESGTVSNLEGLQICFMFLQNH